MEETDDFKEHFKRWMNNLAKSKYPKMSEWSEFDREYKQLQREKDTLQYKLDKVKEERLLMKATRMKMEDLIDKMNGNQPVPDTSTSQSNNIPSREAVNLYIEFTAEKDCSRHIETGILICT